MIPLEIKVIILATLVMGIFLYLDERKIKKERERQDRLHQAYWNNFDNINSERNRRND